MELTQEEEAVESWNIKLSLSLTSSHWSLSLLESLEHQPVSQSMVSQSLLLLEEEDQHQVEEMDTQEEEVLVDVVEVEMEQMENVIIMAVGQDSQSIHSVLITLS